MSQTSNDVPVTVAEALSHAADDFLLADANKLDSNMLRNWHRDRTLLRQEYELRLKLEAAARELLEASRHITMDCLMKEQDRVFAAQRSLDALLGPTPEAVDSGGSGELEPGVPKPPRLKT